MAKKIRFLFTGLFGLFVSLHVTAQNTRQIQKMVEGSEVLRQHFTGFALYDPEEDRMIFSQYADRYFTPASNTKLFTLYTSMQLLGDSIPGLRYVVRGDSLIFWGTGDPTFLHEKLNTGRVLSFLQRAPQRLYYAAGNYKGNFYGAGWPYGDYNDYYQVDKTAFPVAGNVVRVYRDSTSDRLNTYPDFYSRWLQATYGKTEQRFGITRDLEANVFRYPYMPVPPHFEQTVPVKTSLPLTITLLEDTLKRPVVPIDLPLPADAHTLYSAPTDSVLKEMMLPSDNFLAEQLLLLCSSLLENELSTDLAIRYAKKHLLNDLPHEPRWADGSGLSRYNLFTPASIVALLRKIQLAAGDERRLQNLFPAGGRTGTLKTAYRTDASGFPFVWAKTGTLNAVHNQSGFLRTRRGKLLIYSFMNNQFVRPTSAIRAEMVRIMTEIHDRF